MRLSWFGVVMTVLLGLGAGIPVGPHGALPTASAQTVSAQAEAGSAAAPVLTDPETGERYVEVRPTEVIERGRWAVPSWLVWGLAGLATVIGGGLLTRRMTGARRGQ